MTKITIATVKSFINKNRGNLLINQTSCFDGMTDCVQPTPGGFTPIHAPFNPCPKNDLGIAGVWLVGNSRDFCSAYEKDGIKGFRVSNCCGSFIVGITA